MIALYVEFLLYRKQKTTMSYKTLFSEYYDCYKMNGNTYEQWLIKRLEKENE